jgi:hypothetical protein
LVHGSQYRDNSPSFPAPTLSFERTAQVTREEERIRELVELLALANGSNEVLTLAGELKVLMDAKKRRLKGSSPAGPAEKQVGSGGNTSSSFRRRLGELS